MVLLMDKDGFTAGRYQPKILLISYRIMIMKIKVITIHAM